MARGVLEHISGECEGESSDVKYRLLAPESKPVGEVSRDKGKRRWAEIRDARMGGDMLDLGILKPENEEKQLQSSLEEQFADFFEGVVSEWNPCFTDDGQWRYKWDEEIGAHDVDMDQDLLDEQDLSLIHI